MSDHRENILNLLRDSQNRLDRFKNMMKVNEEAANIVKQLEDNTVLLKEAVNKDSDVAAADREKISKLLTAYNQLMNKNRELLSDEDFHDGDSPVYHKSSPQKMVLKKLNVDGHSALCTWIDTNGISIEREYAFTELTKTMPA
jgi:hypothetical protein